MSARDRERERESMRVRERKIRGAKGRKCDVGDEGGLRESAEERKREWNTISTAVPRGNLTFRLGLHEPTDPEREREREDTESYVGSLYATSASVY